MHPNPYESPQTSNALPDDLVDRIQRERVSGLIRRFLASEISAFEFDESLDAFRDSSDRVVSYVISAVWFFYDDLTDHQVTLSKESWDYFQRLLLLLDSDCTLEISTSRRWSGSQVLAILSLLGYAWMAVQFGWGTQLLIVAFPFGIVSMLIARLRDTIALRPYDRILHPFSTFAELKAVYDSTPAFKKVRYPHNLEKRTIHSPLFVRFFQLFFYVQWCMFSPLVLFVQAFPITITTERIIEPTVD